MIGDKKVFGYPEFNHKGEMVITTYEGAYRDMMMDIRVYQMKAGDKHNFHHNGEEMAILLQNGKVTFKWDGEERVCQRTDVFTVGPYALHVPSDVAVTVECHEDNTEILVQRTHNKNIFESKFYTPDDAPWKDVCRGKYGDAANRCVNTIFDYNSAPYSNMVLGEVLNDRGNWSGYLPHEHPQPECYFFRFERPEGFGASFIGNDVYKSTDRSFSAIPGGHTHPQVCAPGYVMYTCWMIRHLDGNPWTDRIDDTRYLWLNDVTISDNRPDVIKK